MKRLTFSAVVLLVIVIAAFFVRIYKFDDWLYFKMDQSRDAMMIASAVERGPQYLPLLGARAGAVKLKHGLLRLGPAFYYFQYVSGKIFNSTQPYVFAYPDLFFSILAIILLYFFACLYFSKINSLLITSMYAFSFLIIQYSRFAWNPNSLQFFLLLTFFALLKFLREPNEKKRRWFLALWAFALTIGSQLHFFGFFSLVGISGLLFAFHLELWKKTEIIACLKKDVLKKFAIYAGIVAVVFVVLYTPEIISEVYKNGENTHNFFEAISSKPAPKPLLEKISKSISEDTKYYCLLTTSQCYGSDMKKEVVAISITVFILLAGIILAVRGLREKTDQSRRDFLALLLIWFGVFFVLTIPVSFQLRPRFFIVVFAIPFIFIGLLFEYLGEKFNRRYAFITALFLTGGIIAWNSYGTLAWFKEQAKAQKETVSTKRTLILKAKDGVTLGQLQGAADYMYSRHKEGATLYYYVKPELVRPFEFLFWEKHNPGLIYKTLKLNEDANAQYFAITPAKNGIEPVYSKYGKDVEVISQKQFGQLEVFEVNFPNRKTSPDFRFNKNKSSSDRIFWKDVFGLKDDGSFAKEIGGDE